MWTSPSVTKLKSKNARGWEEESFFPSKYNSIQIGSNNKNGNYELKRITYSKKNDYL